MIIATPKVQLFSNHNNECIAYAVHGEGPALVVPAWWVSHLELDWQQETYQQFFSQLGQYHTVIRYDRAGSGLSDRDRKEFTLADEVATLSGLIDHLKLDSCAMLGVSCGGPPAMLYALANPNKVNKMIFFGSFIEGQSIAEEKVQNALSGLLSAFWGLGAKTILDLFDPEMSQEQRKKIAKIHKESASAVMADALMKLTFGMDASHAASHLNMPALVMHRIKDNTIPFDAGRKLAAVLNDAEFVALEGSSHLPWVGNDVDNVLKRILQFTGVIEDVPQKEVARSQRQFKKMGDVWALSFADKTVHLKESLGLHDLASLIQNKSDEISASVLAGNSESIITGGEADVLDSQAMNEYRQRLDEIDEEKNQASQCGDEEQYRQLEAEYDAIVANLSKATGLAGSRRKFSGSAEKARKAVSARIKTTIKRISDSHPELGQHLEQTIKTGSFCSYNDIDNEKWLT